GRKRDYAAELGIEARDDGKARSRVVVNINTGELFPLRRWPLEKFARLMERMLDESGFEILLTGSGGEHELVEELRKRISHPGSGRVKNMAGALTLKDTMRLLRDCRLFITNDSGPMHLAVLMGTPVVALFGPTHPAHFLPPERENIAVLYHDYICSPCVHVIDPEYLPCKGDAPCMSSIDVAEVYEAAKRLLEAPGAAEPKRSEVMASMKAYDRE
ncbi:MAG: glycosyltransferase family 9 protein, partial [Deltaproteobacteria bacterium]|nr:glycosyltransferase family 9 protein [Deltaproteobacteria bacterium]